MCVLCDGRQLEELTLDLLEEIDRVGWSIVGVEGRAGRASWLYTVGLSPTFDHPELVIVDVAPRTSELLLNGLARFVAEGGELDSGQIFDVDDDQFSIRWVHPRHFQLGTFALWTAAIEPAFVDPPRRAALQIVPPARMSQSGTKPERWLLVRPRRILGTRRR
jgi:hypothetical protein